MSPLVRGKEIPEVLTPSITGQNDLVQKSRKNTTAAFIGLPLACDLKQHELNIDTPLLMFLQNLHFNTPLELKVDRNSLVS